MAGRLKGLRPARKSADASHSSHQRTESTELSIVAAVLRRCGHTSKSCGGGGGEGFMHQHDSATPECGATTANNGQHACTEPYMAARQDQHSSN